MINKIKELYIKHKEVVKYLLFGGLATVVNFASYFVVAKIIGIDEIVSSGIAWVFAVLFAYITNKLFVFESKTETLKQIIKEMSTFFIARIFSGIVCDIGTFALMVKVFGINDIISKIVTQIMVVILNYVLSKWIIFKK